MVGIGINQVVDDGEGMGTLTMVLRNRFILDER